MSPCMVLTTCHQLLIMSEECVNILNYRKLSIKPPGAYLSKRVLGVGVYSRGGLFEIGGLFIQVNSRVGPF